MARDRTDDTTGRDAGHRSPLQCAWLADSCPMPASWFSHGERPGLCSWHAWIANDQRRNVFEEFEDFCLSRARACCPWAHYSPTTLWQFLHGKRAELPAPAPCEVSGCPHATVSISDEEVTAFRTAIREGRNPFEVKRFLERRPNQLAEVRRQAAEILGLVT